MSTILFSEIIFGPVHSRRLGISLGINLLPADGKLCTFDCIYCECGYNADHRTKTCIPTREAVRIALEKKLKSMAEKPDVITFAGNGEPTVHPDFAAIVDDTIALRDIYFPQAKISVLSNASMIFKEDVFRVLNKVENNILKIDSAFDEKIRLIDRPNSSSLTVRSLVRQMKRFDGNLIIQTMFIKGTHEGQPVDNTSDLEICALIDVYREVYPKEIMIYTIDRETPSKSLEKVSLEQLNTIADTIRAAGFHVVVSG